MIAHSAHRRSAISSHAPINIKRGPYYNGSSRCKRYLKIPGPRTRTCAPHAARRHLKCAGMMGVCGMYVTERPYGPTSGVLGVPAHW